MQPEEEKKLRPSPLSKIELQELWSRERAKTLRDECDRNTRSHTADSTTWLSCRTPSFDSPRKKKLISRAMSDANIPSPGEAGVPISRSITDVSCSAPETTMQFSPQGKKKSGNRLLRNTSLKRSRGKEVKKVDLNKSAEENEVNEAEATFMKRKLDDRDKLWDLLQQNDTEVDDGTEYTNELFNLPNFPRLIIMHGDSKNYYQIRCATLPKLVERLTSPVPEFNDEYSEYLSIFFMTYRSFTSPQNLLKLLIRRFHGYDAIAEDSKDWVISYSQIQQGVCLSITHWFSNHYRDFSSDNILKKLLTEFIKEAEAMTNANMKRNPVKVMQNVVEQKSEKGSYQSFFSIAVNTDNCPVPILPKSLDSATFMDLSELEIARQLTLEEFNMYAEIKPEELQELAWSKPHLKHRAPNVLQMTKRFNRISDSVASALLSLPRVKQRKKLLEKIVKIIEHLETMNSFNMQMALLSAFGNSAIHRLKFTWGAVKPRYVESAQRFQELFSQKGNYRNYRECLKQVSPPAIPFLGVYFTDLTFVDEGNEEMVDGLINFRKKQLEYDVIIQVLRFQECSYQFKLVPKITQILADLPVLHEKEQYAASLELEPRGCSRKNVS